MNEKKRDKRLMWGGVIGYPRPNKKGKKYWNQTKQKVQDDILQSLGRKGK